MFTVEKAFEELNRDDNPDIRAGHPNYGTINHSAPSSSGSSPHMLQNGRIALQDDTTLELGDANIDLPVFTSRSIITIQPGENERAPMPVSSEGWQTTSSSHFVPLSGLDFLAGAETVSIQQTVELQDLLATIESENRYLVKVPRGETLYLATEASSDCQRACCGSARGFKIKLFDQTRQLAMVFERSLACNICWFGCCLQELIVYASQGQIIGRILQQWTFLVPSFFVINGAGNIVYRIEGPPYLLCNLKKGSEFKILSQDGAIQHGTIKHLWDRDISNYNVLIDFPLDQTDREIKSLLLGAGFLLEYMFFEQSKRGKCKCCCC